MTDETVFAAENYSEKIAVKIRTIELLSALDMLCLVILVIMQTLTAMKMAMKNKLLEQRAYTDSHTGLPNKSACEKILNNKEIIDEPTACIMFDLNNLKIIKSVYSPCYWQEFMYHICAVICIAHRILRNIRSYISECQIVACV